MDSGSTRTITDPFNDLQWDPDTSMFVPEIVQTGSGPVDAYALRDDEDPWYNRVPRHHHPYLRGR